MGYALAKGRLSEYRRGHIGALLGETVAYWFAEKFGTIQSMLEAFKSDSENKEIGGTYATAESLSRIPANVKLDYVCGMRREVRKQYVSGKDGIYTDVTPFRHGIISAHGANIFDEALNDVLNRKANE